MNAPLRIEGVDVFVEGGGPQTVVMIHGWPDTYRLWDAQVECLKPAFRCVRFTLPGFGIDEPRRACSLAEILAILRKVVDATCQGRPVVLMLHDWGCFFGYQFAARHPEQVEKIVGLDIGDVGSRHHVRSLSLPAKLMIAAYQLWLALAWRIDGAIGDAMTRFLAHMVRAPTAPPLISARMNYPYYIAWTGAHGSYRQAMSFKPACPLLFVYGSRKPFMFHSPEWLDRIERGPGNQVLALPTGHWMMVGESAAFNSAVLAWLAMPAE